MGGVEPVLGGCFHRRQLTSNAGWLREAVCMHMCPYARFQSVMFDKDTLTISYDAGPWRTPRPAQA